MPMISVIITIANSSLLVHSTLLFTAGDSLPLVEILSQIELCHLSVFHVTCLRLHAGGHLSLANLDSVL